MPIDYAVTPKPRHGIIFILSLTIIIMAAQATLFFFLYGDLFSHHLHMFHLSEYAPFIYPQLFASLAYWLLLRRNFRQYPAIAVSVTLTFIAGYIGFFVAVNTFGS